MFNHGWKRELLTIPNILSLFRLLLIPVYIHMYLNASNNLDYYLAGTVLGISCLTDLLDGKIAREFNMITNTGKFLDPLADKLTQLALILSLLRSHKILYPILGLFLIKEVFQCITMLIFIQRGKVLPGAMMAGKLCTTVLFGTLLLLVLFPQIPETVISIMVILDGCFLLYAFWSYIQAYFGNQPKLTDL